MSGRSESVELSRPGVRRRIRNALTRRDPVQLPRFWNLWPGRIVILLASVVVGFLVLTMLRPAEAENYWLRPFEKEARAHGAVLTPAIREAVDELGRAYDAIGGSSSAQPAQLIPLTDWALTQATGPENAKLASFRGQYIELRARMGWVGTGDAQDDPLPVLTMAFEQSGTRISRDRDKAGALEALGLALRTYPEMKARFAPDGYLDVKSLLAFAEAVPSNDPSFGLLSPYAAQFKNLASLVRAPRPLSATTAVSPAALLAFPRKRRAAR